MFFDIKGNWFLDRRLSARVVDVKKPWCEGLQSRIFQDWQTLHVLNKLLIFCPFQNIIIGKLFILDDFITCFLFLCFKTARVSALYKYGGWKTHNSNIPLQKPKHH